VPPAEGPPPDPRCTDQPALLSFVLDNPLALVLSAALLGHWRGRRMRLAAYLGTVLGRLPPSTRSSIVELAHDEAERLAAVPIEPRADGDAAPPR
jgi:hypothetical protein